MKGQGLKDRFESIPKRNFRNSLIKLLEDEYKIIGSKKLIELLAEDIENLQDEFFQSKDKVGNGMIVFRTTADDGQRQSYGKRTEEYGTITVILPLLTEGDIESRIYAKKGDRNSNYRHLEDRDIKTMVRLLKSAKSQGGLLSGAELCVLMNRSLATIGKYLKKYQESTGEILPLKGYVLDQGSLPTHKGIIISMYEQGISPADISLRTGHVIDAVDRYIKHYEQVKKLIKKGLEEHEIRSITGRSLNVVRQYIKLYQEFNPERLNKKREKKYHK